MSKKKLEKDLKEKDLNTEISEVMEKVFKEGALEKVFTNATKLKCSFGVYKKERTAHNMPISEKCQKCGEKFKENDELYQATEEKTKNNRIICKECAKDETDLKKLSN